MQTSDSDWRAFVENLAIRTLIRIALRMPYERRVAFVGRATARWIAPLAGWRRRIAMNLAYVRPDLTPEAVRHLQRAVPDNAGRALIETYSGAEFVRHAGETPLSGPGVEPFVAARADGRPVVLVTAHLGNYFAARTALQARGHPMAALYKPMRNRRFNAHYLAAISEMGEPLFASDRKGTLGFVRHLARGGIVAMLLDVHVSSGARVSFFGKSAPTSLSAAEWARRYDALVVPIFGIREPDGLGFRVLLDAPVPHGDPEAMTQALNDRIEAQVRAHMDQWFWIHRRWAKDERTLIEATRRNAERERAKLARRAEKEQRKREKAERKLATKAARKVQKARRSEEGTQPEP